MGDLYLELMEELGILESDNEVEDGARMILYDTEDVVMK
jgi:hypothetical protein